VESRLGTGELDHRPRHPLISHIDVPPIEQDHVEVIFERRNELAAEQRNGALTAWLREAAALPADRPR